jgi:hypothetical protein
MTDIHAYDHIDLAVSDSKSDTRSEAAVDRVPQRPAIRLSLTAHPSFKPRGRQRQPERREKLKALWIERNRPGHPAVADRPSVIQARGRQRQQERHEKSKPWIEPLIRHSLQLMFSEIFEDKILAVPYTILMLHYK